MWTLLFALTLPSLAGTQSQATSGKLAYESGDYAGAVAKLEEALAPPLKIKESKLAEVWFTLAQARGRQIGNADSADLEAAEEVWTAFAEGDKLATERDAFERKQALPVVRGAILLHSTLAAREGQEAEAYALLDPLVAAYPDLSGLELRSQLAELAGNAAQAKADAIAAVAAYRQDPPSGGHPTIVKTAARAAIASLGEPAQAKELADFGLATAETLSDEEEARFASTLRNLRQTRLQAMLSLPEHRDETIEGLRAELALEPENGPLQTALATLLGDSPEGMEAYERALQLTPDSYALNYNYGALWVNRAAKAQQESSTNQGALEAQIRTLMRTARQYMDKAHTLQPTKTAPLDALIQICTVTGDDAGLAAYQAKRDAL